MRFVRLLYVPLLVIIVFILTVVVALLLPHKASASVSVWRVGIGGTGDSTSSAFGGSVDQRVGYNSLTDPVSGLRELDRLVQAHRAAHPGQAIMVLGYSQGAAIAHTWVSGHKAMDSVSVVLIADPRRAAGPGVGGAAQFAPSLLPYPLVGIDRNFGSVPVLSICNHDDGVCNATLEGFWGYVAGGRHGAYDFNAHDYAFGASGVMFR